MPSTPKNDQLIIPTTRNSFPPQIISFLFINLIIGSAPIKLGKMFECGVILAPILSILIAVLTTFSIFLLSKALALYHLPTTDELIDHLFGRILSISFGVFTVVFYLLINVQYYGYISDLLGKIILHYQSNIPAVILDPFFLNSLLFVFYIIPIIHTISLKVMFVFSVISVIAILVMIIVNIYNLAYQKINEIDSINQNGKIIYFTFNHSTIFCFSQMISFFQIYPFNYPGIRHLKHNSDRSWTITVCSSIICSLFAFLIIGELKYFIQYYNITNINKQVINTINNIAQLVVIASSFPATMNPARVTIQNNFLRLKTNNITMCYFFGYCFQIASLVISSLYNKLDKYINLIIAILSAILSFIIPAIIYLYTFQFSSPQFAVTSILLILVGLESIILSILDILNVFKYNG